MQTLMRGAKATILDAVGGTPIVKLNALGRHTKAEIYVKCEFLNPGGSMKDRIAINMINDAEARGDIKPGGTIVEGTSGNTGMGLALVGAVRGYKCIFVMQDKQSAEKIRALRAVGAKVVICPTDVEPDDPRSYYSVSRRIAEETPNAYYVNQYGNPSNPEAHYKSTAPEIWEQTGGDFDVFVAGLGTGGTITGCGRYFREQKPDIKVVGVDPVGSLYYDYFTMGKLTAAHPYKVEGIGEDFIPTTIDFEMIDEVIRVTDKECFVTAREMVRQEGILCGGSCGASVAGAIKYAEMCNRPEKILAHLPDTAYRYLSKYLDDDWMRENGYMGPEPGLGRVNDLLAGRPRAEVRTCQVQDSVREVIGTMKNHGISQVPVLDGTTIRGIVAERDLLDFLADGEATLDASVGALVETHFASVDPETPIGTVSGLFSNRTHAVLVLRNRQIESIITQIDLIEFLAERLAA